MSARTLATKQPSRRGFWNPFSRPSPDDEIVDNAANGKNDAPVLCCPDGAETTVGTSSVGSSTITTHTPAGGKSIPDRIDSVGEELRMLKLRVKELEEENASLKGGNSPSVSPASGVRFAADTEKGSGRAYCRMCHRSYSFSITSAGDRLAMADALSASSGSSSAHHAEAHPGDDSCTGSGDGLNTSRRNLYRRAASCPADMQQVSRSSPNGEMTPLSISSFFCDGVGTVQTICRPQDAEKDRKDCKVQAEHKVSTAGGAAKDKRNNNNKQERNTCDVLSSSLDAVMDTYRAAVAAMANGDKKDEVSALSRAGADRVSSAFKSQRKLAFRQFLLLSLDRTRIESGSIGDEDVFAEAGPRYLDAFRLTVADVVDTYPALKSESRDDSDDDSSPSSFKPKAVAPFCMPCGARVRLVPKSALSGARRLGWSGSATDTYHILAFTDGEGHMSFGVAITTVEEVDSPAMVTYFSYLRKRRRASTLIARSFRRWYKESGGKGNSIERGLSRLNAMAAERQRARRAKNANRNAWKFEFHTPDGSFSSESSVCTISTKSSFMSGFFSKGSEGGPKKKPSLFSIAYRKIAPVLDEFMRSSPVPKYDPSTGTGVWRGAKLRRSKNSNDLVVVMRHAPLRDVPPDVSANFFREERARLTNMMSFDPIPIPETSDSVTMFSMPRYLRIMAVRFQEIDDKSDDRSRVSCPAAVSGPEIYTSSNNEVSSLTRMRAIESHDAMLASDRAGEVCLIEKCYVLIGAEPRQQALLLAALQRLVHSERVEYDIWDERQCPTISETCSGGDDSGSGLSLQSRKRKDPAQELQDIIYIRQSLLTVMQGQARLSPEEEEIEKRNECDAPIHWKLEDREKRRFFEMKIRVRKFSSLRLPLPLPQIADEWGLVTLLLRIGHEEVLKVVKLLLLERSFLVLGVSSEEVSSCICALLQLLKPYKWASTFLPLLPVSMLDFLHSPVPFLVGMAADDAKEMERIMADKRVRDAVSHGMSIVNLTKGSTSLSLKPADEQLLRVPVKMRERLGDDEAELRYLSAETSSSIGSLHAFVERGLTYDEGVIVSSIQNEVLDYMKSFTGNLLSERNAWQIYGKIDERTGRFTFYPTHYIEHLCADVSFKKELAHTQMFAGLVDSLRKEEMKEDDVQSPGKKSSLFPSKP